MEKESLNDLSKTPTFPVKKYNTNGIFIIFKQIGVILQRNTRLQIRYFKLTLSQAVLFPIFFLLLLFALQQSYNARVNQTLPHPTAYELGGLNKCQGRNPDEPCITVMFTPDNPQNRLIMENFALKNEKRIGSALVVQNEALSISDPPENQLDIVPVESAEFIYDYVLQNPNITNYAVVFSTEEDETTNYRYQVWYNITQNQNQTSSSTFGPPDFFNTEIFDHQLLSLIRGLDEAIIDISDGNSQANDQHLIDVQLKDWPRVGQVNSGDEVVSSLGSMFFFSAQMIIFINALNNIVTEKEQKLKQSMIMMGLKREVYWISQFLSFASIAIVSALSTCLFGLAFGFDFFRNSNFAVSFLTFVLFGLAMISFAFFITVFVNRSRAAVLQGIFMFMTGLLFMGFIFSDTFLSYIWWDSATDPIIWKVLILLPYFNFGKIFVDVSQMTSGRFDPLTNSSEPAPGFAWADLYKKLDKKFLPIYGDDQRVPDVPAPIDSWYYLLLNIALYFVLAWYLDRVLPDEFGNRSSPIFFLYPSFWGISLSSKKADLENWIKTLSHHQAQCQHYSNQDSDVTSDENLVSDSAYPAEVRIGYLRKVYRPSWFNRRRDKVAVNGLALTLQEGSLLALLGQNGAGKSTTMNILSGLTPPTSGDAWFYGYTRNKSLDAIQSMLGVCPQHDLLFHDLNAIEHIELYAGIKNLPKTEIQQIIEERLKAVRLWKVRHKAAGTYSGGMKRRLSVVISTIGDPRIVFLDEPTTGMDPVNRRHVWTFLEKFKIGRVIILTTHSMEEADVLGDRIAIMAHGRLRALGGSVTLKNKFGAGYRVSINTHPDNSAKVQELIKNLLPGASLQDDSAGSLIYQLPLSSIQSIPNFVDFVENRDHGKLIAAWGISQTTLEEVFLSLIRQADSELTHSSQ